MIQTNGLKNKIISCILSFFLVLGSVYTDPFFIKKVEAAEIGMVGALPGTTTLWEIFQTLFVASGIIIANEEIQNSSLLNLGSSNYSLEELEALGFIRIPEDGTGALNPADWDWSGLENELSNNTSSKDSKVIYNVFSQNSGNGSGGDPEDPWYKKAVNWIKSVVSEGQVKLNTVLQGEANDITLSLGSLSGMISAYYNKYVEMGVPASNADFNYNANTVLFYYNDNDWITVDISRDGELRSFYTTRIWSSGSTQSNTYRVRIAVKDSSSTPTYTKTQYNGSTDTITTDTGTFTDIYSISQSSYTRYNPNIALKNAVYLGSASSDSVVQTAANNWIAGNNNPEIDNNYSPDIITPSGNAIVPTGSPSWVPTPYIDGNQHLEIIPQPDIQEFTEYIQEENPEFAPAGEAWIDTVSPYVNNNPTPMPTARPQPTTKPGISPIPGSDPGGEDNPINVTEPDPMLDIEGGFGTTFDLMDYFPFCIPADFVRAYKIFEVSDDYRQAPYIDYNLKIDRFGIDEHIILDFQMFDSAAALFRILIFITFCISLTIITKTLIWG